MSRDPLAIEMEGLRNAVEQIIVERDVLKERLKKADNALMVACERALYDDALVLKFEDALKQAVEVIKQWHMDDTGGVWQFYYENAPEMKLIREMNEVGEINDMRHRFSI